MDLQLDDLFGKVEGIMVSADKTNKNGQEMLLLTVSIEGKTFKYGIIGTERIKEVLQAGRKEDDGRIILKLDQPKGGSITWIK
jgi:hypothetical protein